MSDKSDKEVLEIIVQNPQGLTAVGIHDHLMARTKVAQWFGKDSLIAALFGAIYIGSIYVCLMRLENDGKITSEWGIKIGNRPRRRYYYKA